MTETESRRSSVEPPYVADPAPRPTRWAGFVVFSAVLLMMAGAFQIIEGIVALIRDDYYLVTRNGLLVTVDYTTWGWTHLIIGVVALITGIGVLAAQTWARVVGILIAALSALAQMAFMPAYPIWSIIVIAIDVLAIYALAAHGREIRY